MALYKFTFTYLLLLQYQRGELHLEGTGPGQTFERGAAPGPT